VPREPVRYCFSDAVEGKGASVMLAIVAMQAAPQFFFIVLKNNLVFIFKCNYWGENKVGSNDPT
ncbi:hypothetical protein, partial [Nostoc sp. 'Peltigera malacea cyanobiont' DB3992]|uniref:hypothetical protein n=1 Tax=Nostoc sp. 'Peltigera malacea cyanobiont' DB3992 TaxID=1206980 RepID=UPI000C067489